MSAHIPTLPPIPGDDITHYRRVFSGGPCNERQKIAVEVVTLVDNGECSPPVLSVVGELDMSPDQAEQIALAIGEAREAYKTALAAHWESLR